MPVDGSALVGRDDELAVLEARLAAARTGHPQVVFVEGEPGMGKSALLDAFLLAHPEVSMAGKVRCDPFEQQLAFGVAGLLLGRWLSDTSEVQVGLELLGWLSDAQAGARTVVLVVDDAQWLDRPSAQALRLALRRLRLDTVLTIVARRPPVAEDPWRGLDDQQPGATTLRLGPLDAVAAQSLTAASRPWALSDAAATRLVERTGGLPLLVAALLRDAETAEDLTSDQVPASASTATHRMLRSLDASSRMLVEAAAVLAEPVELLALGRVAGVDDPAAAATSARAAGLLVVVDGTALDCAHSLLRDAVYQAIPLDRRRLLHRRAADWTDADRRLAHRVAAADRPDPQLLHDLHQAADQAAASAQHQVAATHRLHARSLSTDPRERDDLLLAALLDRVEAQDVTGAEELAEAVRRTAPGPRRSLGLGLLARETGNVAEARSLLGQAMTQAAAAADPALVARSGVAAAGLHVALNEGPDAVAAARTALAATGSAPGLALTLQALGLWQSGDLDGALRSLEGVAPSRDGLPWEVDLLAARGMLRHYAGQLSDALRDLDAAIGLTHLWRPGSNQPRTYVQRSMTRYNLGDWDGAAVDAAAARAVAGGLTQPWSMPLAEAISAQVPANRGQWDEATEHLARARAGMSKAPSTQVGGVVAAAQVLLASARGDHAAVLEVLAPLRSGEVLHRLALVRSFRWVFTAWIDSCVELGRLEEAEQAIGEYEAMLRRWPEGPNPTRIGFVKARLAEARGDGPAAQSHYAQDLANGSQTGNPFSHARLLYASGRLERALGNRREAIDRLLGARRIFTALRADPYLARCNAELAAAGLRGTRSDPLALTQREEDVAALVTRGLSNGEVATALFLTVKTVEYHLGNIYSKLGISSRRELRQLRTP